MAPQREKVAVVRCRDYQPDVVEASVRSAVDMLGGMGRYVSAGQKVLLKVNLLRPSTPDKAIITHPTVVAAVARMVVEAGGVPIIGDSPGGPFTRGRLEQCYRQAGLYEVAAETGAILNFDTRGVQVSHPQGMLMKRLDIMQVVSEVDVVIGLPKLKTHGLVTLTGATKILFGIVPGLIKPGYHGTLAGTGKFAEMLLDIISYVKPGLMIMDAVVGMEGNGPSAGQPRDIGLILASRDSVAMDVVAASIVGLDPFAVPTISAAVGRGLCTGQVADIDIVGERLDEVRVRDFKLRTKKGMDMDLLPPFLRNVVVNQLVTRPWPNLERCTRCGVCRLNCPAEAISLDKHGPAQINQQKCIRCYCCHELCPEMAVDLKTPLIASLINRSRH